MGCTGRGISYEYMWTLIEDPCMHALATVLQVCFFIIAID